MMVFDAVVVVVGVGFGFHVHWAGLLVLTVLLWLLATLMAAFSTAVALVTKEISSFAAVINGINLPLLLLAGVLLPISLGPLWLRVLAHLNPLYYLVVRLAVPGGRPHRHLGGLAGVRRARAAVPAGPGVGDPGVPAGRGLTVHDGPVMAGARVRSDAASSRPPDGPGAVGTGSEATGTCESSSPVGPGSSAPTPSSRWSGPATPCASWPGTRHGCRW